MKKSFHLLGTLMIIVALFSPMKLEKISPCSEKRIEGIWSVC